MDLSQSPNSGQVFRRELQDVFEFRARVLQPADFNQRPTERYVRGEIRGMSNESGRAGIDRLGEPCSAAVLFRQRRKGDRRRVRLDPALQILDAWTIGHGWRL